MTEQKLSQAEISLSSGKLLLGSYRIESVVGQGAQATLYKAEDVHLSRSVALKVFSVPHDEDGADRFKREAHILGSLNHPNIVKTFASGVLEDGRFCMVLEYVPGKSLADYMAQHKQLTMKEFIAVFSSTLGALDYLHEHSVLHRDLKPENILCEMDGDSLIGVKLSDFGIAKIFQETSGSVSLTQTKSIGTAAYMSPEQCKTQAIDVRSDLYSVACVMYQALYGKLPFEGSSDFDTMYKHMNEALPSLAELPEPLAGLLSKGLQKDPAARFQSAKEMSAALPTLDEIELGDSRKIHVERKALRKEKKLSPLLVILLIMLSTGLLGLYFKKTQPSPPPVSSQVDPLLKSLNQPSSPKKIIDRMKHLKEQQLIDYAKSVLLEYPQPKYWEARFEANKNLANAYYALGLYPDSISYCKEALKEALTQEGVPGANLLIGNAYKHLGAKQRSIGDPAWRQNIEKAKKYYELIGSPSVRNEAMAGLCFEYGHGARSAGDYATAVQLFKDGQRCLRKARKEQTDDLYVDLGAELVAIYLLQKKPELVLEEIPKISAAAEGSDYLTEHLISWLIEWADAFSDLGKSEDALRLLQQSETLLAKGKDNDKRMRIALVEVSRGDVFRKKGALKDALPHYEKALRIYQGASSAIVSNDVVRLGDGLALMGQNDLAVKSWELATKIIGICDTRLGANNLPQMHLAYFYMNRKDPRKALEYCEKAKHFVMEYRPDDMSALNNVKTLQVQLVRQLKNSAS